MNERSGVNFYCQHMDVTSNGAQAGNEARDMAYRRRREIDRRLPQLIEMIRIVVDPEDSAILLDSDQNGATIGVSESHHEICKGLR